jgi:hypothetical protein
MPYNIHMKLYWSLACLPLALSAQPANQVTFSKHIAPIIFNNCTECHRPGQAAPFSLMSYQDVAKRGKIIASVTKARYMPPWKADESSFAFRDERRLKESDIALLQEWVKQGMPEGNAKELPAMPKFPSGWRLGEPDLVIEMPEAYHIPADGPDIYRNIAIPLGITENKWITAIEMKPSARSVVHHVLYFADPAGKVHTHPNEGTEIGFSGMRAGGASVALGGWALGAQPHFYPNGLAMEVPKGSDFVIQYHFHPNGKVETEKSVIGFYFAKQAPEKELISIMLPPTYSLFSGLNIPAGEKDYVLRDSYTLPAAVDAIGVSAHAHYIANKMKLTATLPNGEVKTLLSINDWDFAWQDRYFFADSHTLPAGTRLDGEVHWNNSTDNPRNPSNPPINVTWGEQSKDEMGMVNLIAVPHEAADIKVLRQDYGNFNNKTMMQRIKADPGFGKWLQTFLQQ